MLTVLGPGVHALGKPHAGLPLTARMSAGRYALLIGVAALLIGLLLVSLMFGFNPDMPDLEAFRLFRSAVSGVVMLLGIHWLLRYSDNPVRQRMDQLSTWQNVAVRLGLSVSVLFVAWNSFCYKAHVSYPGAPLSHELRNGLLATFVFAFVINGLQIALEAVELSRSLASENALLRQQQLQARYESLKQQLSPHFLFNSLSTLSGLIHEVPQAAEQFVEEMARVYRYLLQHEELPAVPLRDEVTFLLSYVYLLRMRFGESLQLRIDLPEEVQDRLVPPLTLQLLVENAVKHNSLTRRQPLSIAIGLGTPATLVVRNNRQPRFAPEPSSGLGLSNLTSRVRLLYQREIQVDNSAQEFSVSVPLSA